MEIVWNMIVKLWNNHRSIDQHRKDLKRKLMQLNGLKEDADSRMSTELRPRKKLRAEVQIWLGNVERINGEEKKLDGRIGESYTLTRGFHTDDVLKTIREVEELIQQGTFHGGLVVDNPQCIEQDPLTLCLSGPTSNYILSSGTSEPSNHSQILAPAPRVVSPYRELKSELELAMRMQHSETDHLIFSKRLSSVDVHRRLSFPAKALNVFEFPRGESQVVFNVTDGMGNSWKFRLSIRRERLYPKPVLSSGWLAYVRAKGLKMDDRVILYRIEGELITETRFKIQAQRKVPTGVKLFGREIRGEAWADVEKLKPEVTASIL